MYDISILMPSYNQGSFIKQAIDSVLSQRSCRIQLIIMDGGSNDQTLSILQSYGERITYRSEPDRGQSHALNKALSEAKAPIIGWLNRDDMYLPNSFQKVLIAFDRNPNVSMVHGQRILIDSSSRVIGWANPGPFNSETRRYNICSETAFWRNSCITGHKFREDLRFAMDLHFLGTIAAQKNVLYLKSYIGCFRCHDGAKSFNLWDDYAIPESKSVWKDLFAHDIELTHSVRGKTKSLNSFISFLRLPLSAALSYISYRVQGLLRNLIVRLRMTIC